MTREEFVMRGRPGRSAPWEEAQDEEHSSISECFFVSFDIGENLDIPTAVVAKQNGSGFFVANVIQGDSAVDLFEFLTNEEVK